MTLEVLLFWLFSFAACGSAVAVVVTQNLARMAFWLVMSLGAMAAVFFLLDADLLGATQLLIYVGGTVVLLVFGVMLTGGGTQVRSSRSAGDILLGGSIGVALLMVLITTVMEMDWQRVAQPPRDTAGPLGYTSDEAVRQAGQTGRPLGLALLGLRADQLDEDGRPLRPGYLLPFEVVSVHLVVVLIGAAYLARAKRRPNPLEDLERESATSSEGTTAVESARQQMGEPG